MCKVFIREFYPYPTGASIPPSGIRLVGFAEKWFKFESLLKSCLLNLGHQCIGQMDHPSIADRIRDASIRIYAHKTKRDVAGDFFYKQMHMPDLFTLDHLGWGADHSELQADPLLWDIDASTAERFVQSLKQRLLETGCSKLAQPARGSVDLLPDDYIFAPTQTPRDYVQVHHSPISVVSFVELVSNWAKESGQNVVFKLHPGLYHTSEIDRQIIEAVTRHCAESSRVFCVNANVHDLIANANGVFTINSGVGFESLIHGKPVVTFGNCDYKWVTFAAGANRMDEAREYVQKYSEEQRQRANRFVYHYFFRHAYSIESGESESSRERLTNFLRQRLGRGVG
jgi:hypothetical protein